MTDANAKRLFNELSALREPDDCRLLGLRAEGDRASATWARADRPVGKLVVHPRGCASDSGAVGPTSALSASPGFDEVCPATYGAVAKIVRSTPLHEPPRRDVAAPPPEARGVDADGPRSGWRATAILAVVVLMLGSVVVDVLRWRSRNRAGGA